MPPFRVRLYGIDCPEDGQEAGDAATATAALLVHEKTARMLDLGRDRYGRTVAILYLDDSSTVQAALLEAGAAWVAPRYCKRPECRDWKMLEDVARRDRRGLWQYPRPIPPWEWRKRNR